MTLKYKVENQLLHAVGCMRPVVELSRNLVFLELEFDAEWDGAAVTVLFSNDFVENGKTYQKIWNNEPVPVPPEVLETGMLRIGCVGLLDGGETRITTARMARGVQILQCGGIIGVDPAGQTPELWEQLLASMGQLGDLQTTDKSTLVAAINEVLSKAGGGSGSVDPADIAQAVEDYMAANPIQETDPTVPEWAKAPKKPTYTAAEVHAMPDTYTPPVDANLSETSTNPVQNKAITAKLSEVEAIAKGRNTGHVFDTVEAMQEFVADHADALTIGDNLYIRATDVPDYWWDGTAAQPLETQKVDLTEYAKKSEVPVIDPTVTQSGQAADAAAVREQLSSLSEEIVTTSESKVSAHNTGEDSHNDIRLLISGLTDRLNALADSDDTTLDQLSEVVAYIKSNRTLIEAITTSKVSVEDIIDNLTTNVTNKPLSAAQGVALKALIDAISVPDKLPNPNALTFTGAVTGSYDGSEAVSVEIPSGGGRITVTNTAAVGQTVRITGVDETGQPTEWEAVDMASATAVTPELLYSGMAENVTSFQQDIDFKGHRNLVIVVSGTKGDAAISMKEGSLYMDGNRFVFAYYSNFLSAASESAPKGSVVYTICRIGPDRCRVDFSQFANNVDPFWTYLQASSSTQSSAKTCYLKSAASTAYEKISVGFSASVPDVAVEVYGF